MKLFFDTSAFIKRYIDEPGSDEVERLCSQADDIGISILLPVEVVSTISRLKREKHISAQQYAKIKAAFFLDIRDITVIALTPEIVKNAIQEIERTPLKTLDALHIGCALEYDPDYFISSDGRQLFAAGRSGLEIKKIPQ
jgi:uncharacterized protein